MELTETQKLLIYGFNQFPVTKENRKAMFLFLCSSFIVRLPEENGNA